jgi:hypothetical protein
MFGKSLFGWAVAALAASSVVSAQPHSMYRLFRSFVYRC